MTGLEILSAALRADPARAAVMRRGVPIAAGDLLGGARALAVHLRSSGLGQGDVLGVSVSDNAAAMRLMIAAWMCGASPLLLDMRLTARNLADWHARMAMRFLVGPRAAAVPGGPPVLPLPRIVTPLDTLPWEPPTDGELIADYFMSSGTTGLPKVKPITQAGLAERIERWLDNAEHGVSGPSLSVLSLAYPGSRAVWYRSLAGGHTIHSLDLLHSLRELDEALSHPEVRHCTLPPVLIRRLGQLPAKESGPRYPHLLKLWSIGGPATPEDKRRAVLRLSPSYEMTYSSTDCGVTTRISGPEILDRPASCGRPIDGYRVEILDGDRLCAPGETGRIRVHREGHEPAEPGDLGWLDEEGYLYIAGRTNGLMCRSGINVSVAQVEEALLACEQVGDAVVWATPDEDQGDRIHAAIECASGAEAAIAAFVRRALSHQERPDRLHFVRALARGPGGKPDRRAIAEAAATATKGETVDA